MKKESIISITERHIGARYPADIKCISFICMMYHEAGISVDFSREPSLTDYTELARPENKGNIIFLLRKGSPSYLFSHAAIIYDTESVVHYSRYMNTDGVREVVISSFSELFIVYDLVPNPYAFPHLHKLRRPYL